MTFHKILDIIYKGSFYVFYNLMCNTQILHFLRLFSLQAETRKTNVSTVELSKHTLGRLNENMENNQQRNMNEYFRER